MKSDRGKDSLEKENKESLKSNGCGNGKEGIGMLETFGFVTIYIK